MKARSLALACLGLSMGLLAALPWTLASAATGPVVDRIAAVVNDDVIALSEIYELGDQFVRERCPDLGEPCVTEAELEVLDALIRRILIRQELARLQLDVTAADVDQAIDRTAQQYGLDRAGLKAEVEASGKRWDQYREEMFEFLRTQAFQARVLAPRISVSDDEVQDLYQRTSRKVTRPVVRMSGFAIPIPPDATPEAEAQMLTQISAVVAALNSQELSWEEAISKYDAAGLSPSFTDRVVEPNTLLEPLNSALFSAQVGVVQPPLKIDNPPGTADLFFILKVNERTEKSEVAPFEQVKEELRNQVFQNKLIEAEEEWYQRARREAAVDVKLKTG